MAICTRPGCGADFDPSAASNGGSSSGSGSTQDTACRYHPGAPVFHEGSKSWSCCRERNKPVLEFDEFLAIAGCAEEPSHTNVKQPKQTFARTGAKDENEAASGIAESKTPAASSSSSSSSSAAGGAAPNGSSSHAQPAAPTPLTGNRLASAAGAAEQPKQAKKEAGEEEDPVDGIDETRIPISTACKRRGCKATFAGGRREPNKVARGSTAEECRHHPGVAIFHEGSKGYACCRRRVLEFDEFLQIEGCTRAKSGHLFVGGPNSASKKAAPLDADGPVVDEDEVECRIDHYETPADVRITVYAKGVEMERSRIELRQDAVLLSLALPALPATPNNLRRFNRILAPYAPIDATASSFTVTRFKVDLVLVKQARGQSWPALERGDKAFGYGLTFGRKLDA